MTETVEVIDLTQQRAQEFHDLIADYQRNLRDKWVSSLADEMASGRWKLSNDALVIRVEPGKSPVLENGQHRVHARLQVPVDPGPIPVLVMNRLEADDGREEYGVYDAGLKRRFGDWLSVQGIGNANNVAASVRCLQIVDGQSRLLNYDRGLRRGDPIPGRYFYKRRTDPTTTALISYWEGLDHDKVVHWQRKAQRLRSVHGMPATPLAAAFYLIDRDLGDRVALSFFLALDEEPDYGVGRGKASGPVLFRRWISNIDKKPSRGAKRPGAAVMWNYATKAFGYYMMGEERQVLAWRGHEGPLPLITPVMLADDEHFMDPPKGSMVSPKAHREPVGPRLSRSEG